MEKTKFTEQQFAFALRHTETRTRVAEIFRKMCISDPTFYNWEKRTGNSKRMPFTLNRPGNSGDPLV